MFSIDSPRMWSRFVTNALPPRGLSVCLSASTPATDPTTVPRSLGRRARDMPMQYNKLGDSGLLVSELSYGAWVTFMVHMHLMIAEC